jgi:hypothetical protein
MTLPIELTVNKLLSGVSNYVVIRNIFTADSLI